MTIESIIRRRAFRDGFYDGRQGCPMRRLATRKARWLYALGRIFANLAPTNLQVYEQRRATEAAIAAFKAMPVRYGPLVAAVLGLSGHDLLRRNVCF